MNNLKPTQNLQPFRHFCMSIGVLPTSYLESLSYAELLYWFCDYLKNTVILTINNNSDCVKELQENFSSFTNNITNLYNQLKNYVDNYFKNLDVQEEINNKLDEMASNGYFLDLLTQFLGPRFYYTYNNVSEMKNDISLVPRSCL